MKRQLVEVVAARLAFHPACVRSDQCCFCYIERKSTWFGNSIYQLILKGRSMLFRCIAVTATILLFGCATTIKSKYTPGVGVPTANIRLIANTSSTGTLGRHYNLFLPTDDECVLGRMTPLGGRTIAKDHEELPPVAVPAAKSISVVVMYREGRAGQMRSCGNVARFLPRIGGDYNILFDVTDQSLRCKISVEEGGAKPVILEPAGECVAQTSPGKRQIPNGKGSITNINVQIL